MCRGARARRRCAGSEPDPPLQGQPPTTPRRSFPTTRDFDALRSAVRLQLDWLDQAEVLQLDPDTIRYGIAQRAALLDRLLRMPPGQPKADARRDRILAAQRHSAAARRPRL